jgi:GTP cyclohydrolase I
MKDTTIKLSTKQIEKASKTFGKFLQDIGFENYLDDPHMADTPMRVTKAYIEDLFKGMYTDAPKITAFENTNGYDGIVFQGDIEVKSCCSHHFLPFVGKAHVAYIPGSDGKVIGLSKLNRIVEWFARRPQVQENLTMQVHDFINDTCTGNKGVAVMIEAKHMCASCRGVRHDSTMMTSKLSGGFMDDAKVRDEFYNFVKRLDK